ncbi:hypothetical protein CsSME_00013830 [Camellia sinensis var. sinensis]
MAYNRLPSSGHTSPSSPPSSPLRSPRLRHSRSKGGRFSPAQPPSTVARRLAGLLLSVLLRRQGIFLFAPLLYISGMLFSMGPVSFDVVPIINHRPAPGFVYRSPQLYVKLRPEMDVDNSTSDAISTIWKRPKDYEWRACINKSTGGLPESNGYIYIEANGGLNQQRTRESTCICVLFFSLPCDPFSSLRKALPFEIYFSPLPMTTTDRETSAVCELFSLSVSSVCGPLFFSTKGEAIAHAYTCSPFHIF